MAVDIPHPTKHRTVYEALKRQITQGDYRAGDRLPTEMELIRRFGVSRTTVIRALRDLEMEKWVVRRRGSGTYVAARPKTPAETALELGFLAPFVARAADLPYVEGLIQQHLADLARRSGGNLCLQCLDEYSDDIERRFLEAARRLIDRRVRGVFFYPAELPTRQAELNIRAAELFAERGIPVVLIDRDIAAYPRRSPLPRVTYDNRRGGYLLTEHLLQRKCRRIAFVGIPEESTAVADRLAGYYGALRNHDLEVDGRFTLTIDEPTLPFCRDLLDRLRPDGIICKSDRFAAMLGRHLVGLGVRIGRDLLLAGFDDDPIASLLPVPLTTIRLDPVSFALAAWNVMRQQLISSDLKHVQTMIDCSLIVRQSTGEEAD